MRRFGILFLLAAAFATFIGCELIDVTTAATSTEEAAATTSTAASVATTTTVEANATTITTTSASASTAATTAPALTTIVGTTTAAITTTATTTTATTTTAAITTTAGETTTIETVPIVTGLTNATTADPGPIEGALIDEAAHLFASGMQWYDIVLEEDGLLRVYSLGTLDLQCLFFDPDMMPLFSDDDSGFIGNFMAESYLTAGTYHLAVFGYDETVSGDYRIVAEILEDTDADFLVNAEVEHVAGAVDRYDFTITQEGSFTAYTQGFFDTFAYLYDSEGYRLFESDDDGTNYNIRFDAYLMPGDYYITVQGYESTGTGAYRMVAYFIPEVAGDHFYSHDATLLAGGEHEYEIIVDEAGYLTITTLGSLDTYGFLFDDAHEVLENDDDSGYGYNFMIECYVGPGTYYVSVEGVDDAVAGDYRFNADFVSERSLGHLFTAEGSIDLGGSVWYDIVVPEESYIMAYAESGMDTYAELYDSDMVMKLDDDDANGNGDFLILYRAQAGTYHLKVCGYDATDEGDYRLVVDLVPIDGTISGYVTSTFATVAAGIGETHTIVLTEPGYLTVFTISSIDTFGSMYDGEMALLFTDDDSYSEYNFILQAYVEAGTYTFIVEGYDEETSGTYLFLVGFAPNVE